MTATDAIFETVAATASDIQAALAQRRAYEEAENPSGDRQLAAEVHADELLERRLLALESVGTYASEERENAVEADDGGEYHVACDPLDGSSNLQSNNGMGTIVAVFDTELPAPGEALVAAGYVLYGPITTMLEANDGEVTEYLVEDGDRSVLNEDVRLPDDPLVYGFGGRVPDWTKAFQSYVDEVEEDRLKLRYGGAMVADINQVVTYGGVFGYPMLKGTPEGKLRLQFEGHPIAHAVETAGGASSNGSQSLLDCTPGSLHERSPVFVGSEELIGRLEDTLDGQ
jgi:fructose-1,6-bisphosphatase I